MLRVVDGQLIMVFQADSSQKKNFETYDIIFKFF